MPDIGELAFENHLSLLLEREKTVRLPHGPLVLGRVG